MPQNTIACAAGVVGRAWLVDRMLASPGGQAQEALWPPRVISRQCPAAPGWRL